MAQMADLALPSKTEMPLEFGGQFTAVENPDGTWNIQDVPVFCSHKVKIAGANGKTKTTNVNKKWLTDAVKRGKHRFRADGYLPPLHIHHHHQGRETERAGFFRLRGVKRGKYEGKNIWVLHADLLRVPCGIYERIKAGELPYRSVEIHDVKKPEIDSLGLLDDEVPFFRLCLLTVGREVPYTGDVGRAVKLSSQPVVAYRELGHGAMVLTYARGQPCVKGETAAKSGCVPSTREGSPGARCDPVTLAPKALKKLDKEIQSTKAQKAASAFKKMSPGAQAAFVMKNAGNLSIGGLSALIAKINAGGDEKAKAILAEFVELIAEFLQTGDTNIRDQLQELIEQAEQEFGGYNMPDVKDETMEEQDVLMSAIQALQDYARMKYGEEMPPVETAEDDELVEDEDLAPAPVEQELPEEEDVERQMSNAPAAKPKYSLAQAMKYKAEHDLLKREVTLERAVHYAATELAPYGLDQKEVIGNLTEVAKEHGVDAIKLYVDAVKESAQEDPPSQWTGELPKTELEKGMEQYAGFGAEATEKALTYAAEYDLLAERMRLSYDRDTYVKDCLMSEGFKARINGNGQEVS